MKPYYVLDIDNRVVPESNFSAWIDWVRENADRMEVSITAYPHCHILTTFLGVESAGADAEAIAPEVFETVIIGGPHDSKTVVASTWHEARQNHIRVSEALAREALQCSDNDGPSPFQE